MKRRAFIFNILKVVLLFKISTLNKALTSKKVLTLNSNIKYHLISLDKYHSVQLPKDPKPFQTIVEFKINSKSTSYRKQKQIFPNGNKIFGKYEAKTVMELTNKGSNKFLIQYVGKDLGWIVLG